MNTIWGPRDCLCRRCAPGDMNGIHRYNQPSLGIQYSRPCVNNAYMKVTFQSTCFSKRNMCLVCTAQTCALQERPQIPMEGSHTHLDSLQAAHTISGLLCHHKVILPNLKVPQQCLQLQAACVSMEHSAPQRKARALHYYTEVT